MSDIQAIHLKDEEIPERVADINLSVFDFPWRWKSWYGFWKNIESFYKCVRAGWQRATQGYCPLDVCNCGDSYIDDYVGAHGHSCNEWELESEPTCQIKGIEKISDLNNLSLLEDCAFRNNNKLLEKIGEYTTFKNYIVKADEVGIDEKCGYPFLKYDNMEYRWKFPWCGEDNLQMYENIPGKTFTEHIANAYDNMKHVTFIAKNQKGLKNMF